MVLVYSLVSINLLIFLYIYSLVSFVAFIRSVTASVLLLLKVNCLAPVLHLSEYRVFRDPFSRQ